MSLPECCTPSPNADRAETLYCLYQTGGPPERAGLAWDGRPCPTWADLTKRADEGDTGAVGVIAKWRYVAAWTERREVNSIEAMIYAYVRACHPSNLAAPGAEPYLWAFCAGWACREIGVPDLPRATVGRFLSSWRRGWDANDRRWSAP